MTGSCKEMVERARSAFNSGRTRSVEFRRQQLNRLKDMYIENKETFIDAIVSDLRKPRMEAIMADWNAALQTVNYLLKRLDKFTKVEEVGSIVPLDRSRIIREPYGVVLVLGAWNYPVLIMMEPVHGAIAAGNAVVIKPSEVAPATAAVFAKLVPQYLDKDCYPVLCGGVPETTELLKERFDYIFYTGNTTVGKIIREAANKHLTPVTLELGGKSPCYLDHTVNLDLAVRRIMWGKFMNMGQTCIAPDYLLCTREIQDKFIGKAREVLQEWFGPDPKKSPDLGRIVAERHVDRLATYLDSGKAVIGGGFDRAERWVEPTILVDVALDSKVMQEEIFGPILPIINIDNHVQAIQIIRSKEKPLALYLFTQDEEVQQMFLQQVQCGGVCINDTIFHILNPNLPFGGVGCSGMGVYHGKYSFETFSHRKAVLSRSYNSILEKVTRMRFPPYTEKNLKMMTMDSDRGDGPGVLHYAQVVLVHLVSMAAGALLLYLSLHYTNTRV